MNWSVSSQDEACSYFLDILNNYQTGLDWMKIESIDLQHQANGWMIDSFGHSQFNFEIMMMMGIQNNVIARMNDDEKSKRRKSKELYFDFSRIQL